MHPIIQHPELIIYHMEAFSFSNFPFHISLRRLIRRLTCTRAFLWLNIIYMLLCILICSPKQNYAFLSPLTFTVKAALISPGPTVKTEASLYSAHSQDCNFQMSSLQERPDKTSPQSIKEHKRYKHSSILRSSHLAALCVTKSTKSQFS